jgi:hypothetical protein
MTPTIIPIFDSAPTDEITTKFEKKKRTKKKNKNSEKQQIKKKFQIPLSNVDEGNIEGVVPPLEDTGGEGAGLC